MGVEQEDLGGDFLRRRGVVFAGQEVEGTLVAVGAVLAASFNEIWQVAILVQKVGAVGEEVGVEELGLDGGVDAFDVGVGVGAAGCKRRSKSAAGGAGKVQHLGCN